TYRGSAYRSVLTGSALAPIVVRQYPGERAVLDAAGATSATTRGDFFVVEGSYAIYWGFELMDSNPNRTSATRPNMLINDGAHNSYVNLVVHDGGVGFYTYANTATGVEINGCLFYDNGWQGPGWGEGHALYLKSDAGPLVARDNIMFNQFGYGTQIYSNFGD